MKWLTFFFLIFSAHTTLAYSCPQSMDEKQIALRDWLEPLRGVHELGPCKIEITVCAGADPDINGAVIGEVFVIDGRGREAYLPLVMTDSAKIEGRARLTARLMNYLKRDKYTEEVFGRTEVYRLEIKIGPDGMTNLDLGTYSTNKRLRRPDGSQSRWHNCGG